MQKFNVNNMRLTQKAISQCVMVTNLPAYPPILPATHDIKDGKQEVPDEFR